MAHGGGGQLTGELIREIFLRHLGNPLLSRLEDAACLSMDAGGRDGRLAFTTDAFVVSPPFFPGGDIGRLAVCGTVNDLAVMGARPLALSASFILEEGLPMDELEKAVVSMAATVGEAGVAVVTGDTKVVERGKGDRLFITTAGIGWVPSGLALGTQHIRPGDAVIVSGPVGDHGIAVLSCRPGIQFETTVVSDCCPLNGIIARLFHQLGERAEAVRFLRDPTRGGLATVLVEAAAASGTDIVVEERGIPVRAQVRGAAELLGLDPLYLANEGKFVLICAREEVEGILNCLREEPEGQEAAVIGSVREGRGRAFLQTVFGGKKILDLLSEEEVPRIC